MKIQVADDFNFGTLSKFWDTKRAESRSLIITGELNLGNKKCLKIIVNPGDKHAKGGRQGQETERTEIGEHKDDLLPIGIDAWYGLSFFVPNNFQIVNNRLIIAQWKANSSSNDFPSPVISIRYKNGKIIGRIIDESKTINFEYPSIKLEKWYRISVNFNIAENHFGYCKFYLNGEKFGEYIGHIGYDRFSAQMYFKMGLYRDKLPYKQSLYFSQFRRGTSQKFCDKI